MSKSFAVLPCNGLDKCAGSISREIALRIQEKSDSEIFCPVFYRTADARYNRIAEEKPVLVIDGCATRCASKLAVEKGLKIAQRLTVTEGAKSRGTDLGKSLRLGEKELALAELMVEDLLKETEPTREAAESHVAFPEHFDYEIFHKDKFVFRLPREGFYFNENDCWVYVVGNRARVGVTDYVQQTLSDIMFFTPPDVGSDVEQFGELGEIESSKAVFEVVSPVSGRVVAINEDLTTSPELINENPYEKGWIAEIELTDFESDRELLLDFDHYLPVMKRKVDEFHV